MKNIAEYVDGSLSSEKEERLIEQLISAKLDRDQSRKWEQRLRNEYGVTRKKPPTLFRGMRSLRYLFSIAASLLLIATAFYFSKSKSPKDYGAHIDQYIASLDIMGDQTLLRKGPQSVDSIARVANEFYVNKRYIESLEHWQQLIALNQAKSSDYFYLGICQLKRSPSAPELAIAALNQSASDTAVNQERNWVLALAYAKVENLTKSSELLEKIASSNGYQAGEARELLKLLAEMD